MKKEKERYNLYKDKFLNISGRYKRNSPILEYRCRICKAVIGPAEIPEDEIEVRKHFNTVHEKDNLKKLLREEEEERIRQYEGRFNNFLKRWFEMMISEEGMTSWYCQSCHSEPITQWHTFFGVDIYKRALDHYFKNHYNDKNLDYETEEEYIISIKKW